MKKLTDLLKEAGIEMGKVYTDKDRPPFKVNEFKSFNDRFRNMDTIRIKDKREHQRIMKYLDKKGWSYMDIGHGNGEWHIQFDNTREASRIRRELEKKRFKIIDPNNESVNEASDKIRVQGLGVYDYKSLSKKVGKLVGDLSNRNRKGNHMGIGKRQLGTLAAMWEALSDYEENN
jgi:hypothetical protein